MALLTNIFVTDTHWFSNSQNVLKIDRSRRNWQDFIISHLIFITNFPFTKFLSHYLYQTVHADEVHKPLCPFWQSIYNWSTINIFTDVFQAKRKMWQPEFCTFWRINVWSKQHQDLPINSGIWVFPVLNSPERDFQWSISHIISYLHQQHLKFPR